jgi:hypothetical protein
MKTVPIDEAFEAEARAATKKLQERLNGEAKAEAETKANRKPASGKGRRKATNADLDELNKEFAVVRVGGKTRVMEFEESPARRGVQIPVYASFEDFKKFQDKYRVTVPDGQKHGTKEVGRGTWWLQHPDRRQYRAVVFEPGASEAAIRGKFNLWRGFAVAADDAGDCSLYIKHLEENICSGNVEHFEYLLNWMAWGVQNPGERAEVAVVMRGGEGAGKGMAIKTYGALFGAHYAHATKPEHVVGKFNAHLQQCSVLFADEAFFAGDRSSEGHLKGVITEETLRIEPKGVDSFEVRNCLKILMSSNSDWVIPAGADARRYFALSVCEAHKQDLVYFRAIAEQLSNGGREALLHFLQNRDLSGFDIRAVPMTEALAEQKAYSRRGLDALVELLAAEGDALVPHATRPNVAITSGEKNGEGFWPKAYKLVPSLKHQQSRTLARQLKKSWGCKTIETNGVCGLEFPPLDELRAMFDAKHGKQEWEGPTEWTAQ